MTKVTESQLQSQCVAWFSRQYPKLVLFAVPNGGKRSIITAAIQKREGVKPGVSDLVLLIAKGGYNALMIEMKLPKTKQTDTQLSFQKYCEANNYKYIVCRSFEEFQNEINNYLTA